MISCNIKTISYTDCILTIQDSGGITINEFMLGNLKMFQNDTMETLYLNDGSTEITINLAQLPSINGGVFATLLDLFTYIETQRNLCQCGCGGGGGGSGTVTSVDLTMPSAFSVSGNPITTAGTLAVTGAGLVSQYIRGDGSLANFPAVGGGGASQPYYLNGGTNQGVFVGNTYYEMSRTPVLGIGADFNIAADGIIARFLTDSGDPALLNIPAGNWNFEMYFSASSSGGTPTFSVTLYKYDGASFTSIATSSATPETITGGTAIDLYFTALTVPATTLTATDRLAISIDIVHDGRTITLHTQDSHLCQINTTFSTGISALNGLTDNVQSFSVGTTGTDFNISSASAVHNFNLPTASATKRGALSTADWTTFNGKQAALTNPVTGTGTNNEIAYFNATGSTISSLAVATYPSLTELSYVKGVTSAVQTQINSKLASALTTGQIFLGVAGVATASSNPRAILNSMLASNFVGASTTSYYQPASAQVTNATENNRRYFVNNDCLAARLLVQTATAQNSGGSCVVSINKNGVATGISITIAASSAAGVFTDYVNSIAVSAGDYLTIKVINNAAANSAFFTQISFNLF